MESGIWLGRGLWNDQGSVVAKKIESDMCRHRAGVTKQDMKQSLGGQTLSMQPYVRLCHARYEGPNDLPLLFSVRLYGRQNKI